MKFKKIDMNNKKEVDNFLDFPKKLYSKKLLTQNRDTEFKLLTGTHILSRYSDIEGYLLYVNDNVVCRCVLTINNASDICYLGFFESINNLEYVTFFLENIDLIIKNKGVREIIGPIDASFWIKYRMKISNFNNTYTGEPTNKDYYFDLFTQSGYKIKTSYVSNFMEYSTNDNLDNIICEIEQKLSKLGREYVIENLHNKDKNKVLTDLYYLFSSLYSKFPIYSDITKEEFIYLFKDMLKLINEDFVLLAYDSKGNLVGFTISIPDYQNLIYEKLTLFNLIKILKIKKNPKRIINLYMGVCHKDLGLGKLLTYKLAKVAKSRDIKAVAALIMDGKVTGNYFKSNIANQTKYVILNKKLK